MNYRKFICGHFRILEILVFLVVADNLLIKLLVGARPHRTRVVESVKYTKRRFIDNIYNFLVILILNFSQVVLQPLLNKLLFFRFEHITYIQLLQFFVGKVYAHLLERINREILESKDIQQTQTQRRSSKLIKFSR